MSAPTRSRPPADRSWPGVHRQAMLVRYPEHMTLELPTARRPLLHLHRFRWAEHGPIGTLYVCRCGSVRPGL